MKKIYRIIFIVLITLTVLFLITIIALPILESRVESQLTQMLNSNLEGAEVELEEFDVDLIAGNLDLKSLKIKDPQKQIDSMHITELSIDGIHWLESYRSKALIAQNFYIRNGAFNYIKSDSSTEKTSMSVQDSIVHKLKIDQFRIDTFNFNFLDSTNTAVSSFRNSSVEIHFKGKSILNPIHGKTSIDSFKYAGSKGFYNYRADSIGYNIDDSTFHISNFRLIPQYGKDTFSRKYGERKGRFDLTIPEINARGINIDNYINQKTIVVRRILMDNMKMEVYENTKMAINKDRYLPLPQEFLRKQNQQITIDTIQCRSMDIRYETINPKTRKNGHIDFNNSFISLYNLTTDSALISRNPNMTVDFQSQFMSSGKLTGSFNFNLSKPNYPYTVKCHLGRMQIANANTITIPVINLNILSGLNKGLDVEINADAENYTGVMNFAYKDLEVEVIDRDDDEKKKVLSWIANKIFIKTDNIRSKANFRQGSISQKRVTYHTFFKNLWEALESGFATTILGENRAEQVEKRMQ